MEMETAGALQRSRYRVSGTRTSKALPLRWRHNDRRGGKAPPNDRLSSHREQHILQFIFPFKNVIGGNVIKPDISSKTNNV